MKSFRQMSTPEFHHYLEVIAKGLAAATQSQCSEDQAWAWAERNFSLFLERAIDLAALLEASQEKEACGSN